MNREIHQQFQTPDQKQDILEEVEVYFLGHIHLQKPQELILFAMSFHPICKILQVGARQEMLGVAN
jgi:hypothetical protein